MSEPTNRKYNKLPTVGELLRSISKDAVLDRIEAIYHENMREEYGNVLDELIGLQPKNTSMKITLNQVWERAEDRPPRRRKTFKEYSWISIDGLQDGTAYAIEFMDWREWLSMPVLWDNEMGQPEQITALAHVLYEMTVGGLTNDHRQQKLDDLNELFDEVKEIFGEDTNETSNETCFTRN